MYSKLFYIFILNLALTVAEKKSYEGYKLYKTIPETAEQVESLVALRGNGIAEFWDDNIVVNHESRMMVRSEKEAAFQEITNNINMKSEVLLDDIQRVIDEQLNPIKRSTESSSFLSFDWDHYHTLEEIYAWFDRLAYHYPEIVTIISMGTSVENREIKGVKINYGHRSTRAMLEGTLHAREWISAATLTWIIKEFLTSTNPDIRYLAERYEWHIFPVVNPDGYSYTFTDNRMWRKNRSTANFTSCAPGTNDDMSNGVDLNRNFDFVWMSTGASNDSCSNTFAGPEPFSEPESRAIADYVSILNENEKLFFYIAFHSFSQLVVIPYSHVRGPDVLTACNYGDMYEIGIRGADKLREKHGTNYRVGVSADVMYEMSGTSFDWVKYAVNVPVSLLLEMRDTSQYGFLLPPEQIIPNSEEVMEFLLEMERVAARILKLVEYGSASSIGANIALILIVSLIIL